MGRFSRIDFEAKDAAIEPAALPLSAAPDPWPNEDAPACIALGDEQFARGLYEAALASYSRALRFERDMDAGWVGQVRCLICLGDYPEAVLWSDRGLERLRSAPDLLAGKGLALVLRGDTAEGMAYLDGAVEMRSPSAWVWLARGEALLATGQAEANAHRCFLKALEIAPRDAPLELRIGMAYNRARSFAAALAPLQSAERNAANRDNPLALYHLGLTHEGLGDFAKAAGYFERAIALRRDFIAATQGLERTQRSATGLWGRLRRQLRGGTGA